MMSSKIEIPSFCEIKFEYFKDTFLRILIPISATSMYFKFLNVENMAYIPLYLIKSGMELGLLPSMMLMLTQAWTEEKIKCN